jgi:IS5 family transposase
LSFKGFVGLSLEDAAPNNAVLNRSPVGTALEKLFGELDRQLENAGVIMKRGTMLDATVIQAASAENRPSNDPNNRSPIRPARMVRPSVQDTLGRR